MISLIQSQTIQQQKYNQLINKTIHFYFQIVKYYSQISKTPAKSQALNIKNYSTMQKLSSFLKKSSDKIANHTRDSIQNLIQNIQKYSQQTSISNGNLNSVVNQDLIAPQSYNNNLQNLNNFDDQPLQNLQLKQSKMITLENKSFSELDMRRMKSSKAQSKSNLTGSRIEQIQLQKKRILDELKKLDGQIAQIKQQKQGSSLEKSQYHKKIQIADDLQAKKQAQSLIKQLHLQKAKIQEKKRRNQQKQLQMHKRQQQQRRKQKQQLQKKLKQQKRLLIQRRLQQQKKKRLQRQMVDKQSNALIQQLKKQQQLQRQRSILPSQIMQYQHKKKLLEKKNIFNINQIEDHQRKYKQFKSKQKQLRRERSESIRGSNHVQKYGKNIWVQKIQEEQTRRKQEEKMKQLNRRKQLQKRMKYGDLVKNIFMSKHKKKQHSEEQFSKQQSVNQQNQQMQVQAKPRTPDVKSHLPKIPQSENNRQNRTDNKFKGREPSTSNIDPNKLIEKKRSRVASKTNKQMKQKDPEQQQKLQKQKQREAEIRKQTKQRLKKLQNHNIELPKPEKVKYENYMAKVKVKKQNPNEQWKKIMDNQSLSKQQKYKQMLNKASYMQNQAKIKQDLRKSGDEDAVNLYIGSIQAKLALLQRF